MRNQSTLLCRTNPDITSGNAVLETPPAIFAKLHEEFNFEIDLCADPDRHHCPIYFGPRSPYHTNALQAPWAMFGSRGFCNPPYGAFVPYLLNVAHEMADFYGFTSVLLLPLRANKAFHRHVLGGATELRFCDKRITFFENGAPKVNPKTGKTDPAPFDSILVVFRPGRRPFEPSISSWAVPPHVGTPASTRTPHDLDSETSQAGTRAPEQSHAA